MIRKISPLVKFDILGVFVNTLTVNRKYPVPILKTVKEMIRPLSEKHHFRTSFDSENVKVFQTLVKYP